MSVGHDVSVRVVLKGIDQASPSIRKVSRSFKTLRSEAQAVSKSMVSAIRGIKSYAGEIRSPLQFSEGAMRKMRREANKLAVQIPKTNKQFRVFGVTLRTLSAGIQSVIGGLLGFSILREVGNWIRDSIDNTAFSVKSLLEGEARIATGADAMQSGIMGEKQRTLGEVQQVQSNANIGFLLQSKINAWGEKDYWRYWYREYKANFPRAQKKLICLAVRI